MMSDPAPEPGHDPATLAQGSPPDRPTLSPDQLEEAALACRRHNFTRRAVTLWFVLLAALITLAITGHVDNVTVLILFGGGVTGSLLLYRAKS